MKKPKKKAAKGFWWISDEMGQIYANSKNLDMQLNEARYAQEWWIQHIPRGNYPKLNLK